MPVPCFHADSSSVIQAQGTSFLALHLLLTQHMNSQMAGTSLVNDTVVAMRDGSPAIVSQLQPASRGDEDYETHVEASVHDFLDHRAFEDDGEGTSLRDGFYYFVMKGSYAMRLSALGVFSEGQAGLSASQRKLREIANEQSKHFDETPD